MPRPRILAVAPEPFYEDRGTPIAVLQLLTALTQLRYPVDLLTYPVGATPDLPGLRILRVANPWRIRHVPVGLSAAKVLLDLPLVVQLRRRLATGDYACVHAVEESAFAAAMLGHRFGVPVIYDMQSSLPEQLASHRPFRTRPVQAGLRACERWLWRNVDAVVASAGLGDLVRRARPDLRVREWRYAAGIPAENHDGREVRESLGIPSVNRVVLYSGTFEPYQGIPLLLEALPRVLAEMPEVTLVLLGAQETAAQELAERHQDLVRRGALRVVTRQPRAAVSAYLAAADVLVSPRSLGNNLPLKIFDYLAAGRPIVATDMPAHRAALDEACAVLVSPAPGAVSAAIVELLRDPERSARLAQEGRARAAASNGWTAFVRSVEELYSGVLAPDGESAPLPANGAVEA